MNGGTWLIIDKQRVNFIYREIEFVDETISNCIKGKIETDYYQQPAFGFYSYIYCSEIKFSKILYDPSIIITKLKQKVVAYPQLLKEKIINTFLWDTQFSLSRAQKSAKRNETYIVAGCLIRIINDLTQVLYALNETFFISEKRYLIDIPTFKIKPNYFLNLTDQILDLINNEKSLKLTENLINSLIELSKNIYEPKYSKNLDKVK